MAARDCLEKGVYSRRCDRYSTTRISATGHSNLTMSAAIRRRVLTVVVVFLMTFAVASAHMAMAQPPALRYKTNPYKTTEDYDYTSPLSSSGSNYPCKGYQVDMGTPAGQSVATYSPGGTYTLQ
jgi:hypothetical protein